VNQVEFLSSSYCSHEKSGNCPIWLLYGHQIVYNTNSSMNNALWVSGIYIYHPNPLSCSHCTFSNNNDVESICVTFDHDSGTMSYANFNNNSPSAYGVVRVIAVHINFIIAYSIIIKMSYSILIQDHLNCLIHSYLTLEPSQLQQQYQQEIIILLLRDNLIKSSSSIHIIVMLIYHYSHQKLQIMYFHMIYTLLNL